MSTVKNLTVVNCLYCTQCVWANLVDEALFLLLVYLYIHLKYYLFTHIEFLLSKSHPHLPKVQPALTDEAVRTESWSITVSSPLEEIPGCNQPVWGWKGSNPTTRLTCQETSNLLWGNIEYLQGSSTTARKVKNSWQHKQRRGLHYLECERDDR